MSRMFFALAASFAAAAAAPAVAVPSVPGVRTVSYADLDLSSAAGRGRLDLRIAAAVRAVCGTAAPADLRAAEAVRDCRAATLAEVSRTR